MGVFEHFPYVNFHELNLNWIVKKLKELEEQIIETDQDPVARAGVAANAQAISDLTTEVSNNKTTAHNEAVAASNAAALAQGTADANTAALNRQTLAGRKFVFIGDSYDAGWTPDGTYPGWGERAAAVLKKTLGSSYWNQYYGGAGFGFADDNPMSFYYQIQTVINNLTTAQKESITDIVIGGGRNDDLQSGATVNTGIDHCATLIANNFPNAKVWLFAIGWDGDQSVRTNLVTKYYENYSRTVDKKNWSYHALYQLLHDRSLMGSDLKHPNNDGNYLLGNQIGNILCGSTVEAATIRYTVSINGYNTGGLAFRNGNMVTFLLPYAVINMPSGISHTVFTDSGAIIDSRPLFGQSSGLSGGIRLNAVLQTVNNEYYNTEIFTRFYQQSDGTMTLAFRHNQMNKNHSDWLTDADINQVQIQNQMITIPIEWA